jgi:hypothetical protein
VSQNIDEIISDYSDGNIDDNRDVVFETYFEDYQRDCFEEFCVFIIRCGIFPQMFFYF